MQNIKLIKKSKIPNTFKTQFVKNKFDIDKEEIVETFELEFDFPKDWKIGVIVGNSGTGKSTIAKELFKLDKYEYGNGAIVDEIVTKESVDVITQVFNRVGFSSPPSWLKPYSVLSNGEKMRVDLAQSVLNDKKQICFDEFTSVVDRNVAKMASFCIQKYIRKSDKQFVAVACHFDILEWLEPDWIIDTNTMSFHQGKGAPIKDPLLILKSENVSKANGISLKSIII